MGEGGPGGGFCGPGAGFGGPGGGFCGPGAGFGGPGGGFSDNRSSGKPLLLRLKKPPPGPRKPPPGPPKPPPGPPTMSIITTTTIIPGFSIGYVFPNKLCLDSTITSWD